MINRRNFIRNSALTGVSLMGLTEIVHAAMPSTAAAPSIKLSAGDKILFQGDSITDAGRNKENHGFNNPSILGGGYAFLAAAELLHQHADKNLQIYSNGSSPKNANQLAACCCLCCKSAAFGPHSCPEGQ